jgi:uncharacterized protein YnzC (UPF0291/DUF896 family)
MNRYQELARKGRSVGLTPPEQAEYDNLRAAHVATVRPVKVKGWHHLPMAGAIWATDGKDSSR